jgi:hypothetical protein
MTWIWRMIWSQLLEVFCDFNKPNTGLIVIALPVEIYGLNKEDR